MKKLICLVLAIMLALSAVSALAAEYTDKDTVKKVQQALNDAGYDCGTPDGAAGKKTKAAITSYQTDKGLTVTGIIDDELLVALGLTEAEPAEEAPADMVEDNTDSAAVKEGLPHINFRGAEFGSTAAEVKKTIDAENVYIDEMGSLKYPLRIDDIITFYGQVNDKAYDRDVYDKFAYSWLVPINVAGYDATFGANLFFVKPIKNDVPSEQIDDSIFYAASYLFIPHDVDVNDLSEKLTSLYGQSTHTTIDFVQVAFGNEIKNKSSAEIWHGENDVDIILSSCESLGVNLVYAWRGAEPLIEKAFEISDIIGDTITGNTSGL